MKWFMRTKVYNLESEAGIYRKKQEKTEQTAKEKAKAKAKAKAKKNNNYKSFFLNKAVVNPSLKHTSGAKKLGKGLKDWAISATRNCQSALSPSKKKDFTDIISSVELDDKHPANFPENSVPGQSLSLSNTDQQVGQKHLQTYNTKLKSVNPANDPDILTYSEQAFLETYGGRPKPIDSADGSGLSTSSEQEFLENYGSRGTSISSESDSGVSTSSEQEFLESYGSRTTSINSESDSGVSTSSEQESFEAYENRLKDEYRDSQAPVGKRKRKARVSKILGGLRSDFLDETITIGERLDNRFFSLIRSWAFKGENQGILLFCNRVLAEANVKLTNDGVEHSVDEWQRKRYTQFVSLMAALVYGHTQSFPDADPESLLNQHLHNITNFLNVDDIDKELLFTGVFKLSDPMSKKLFCEACLRVIDKHKKNLKGGI